MHLNGTASFGVTFRMKTTRCMKHMIKNKIKINIKISFYPFKIYYITILTLENKKCMLNKVQWDLRYKQKPCLE
jgi:hypothetical protein